MLKSRMILALLIVAGLATIYSYTEKANVHAASLIMEGGLASGQGEAAKKIEIAADNDSDADVDPEGAAEADDRSDSDMPLREDETISKTFNLGTARKVLEVDNISGSIEVTGGESSQAQLVVKKTIRAESKAQLEAAKKEVTLDITDQPELLKFYVNGPFRCNCQGDGDSCRGWHGDRGYDVAMNFQIQVPRNIDIKLKTVNGGHVDVRNINGAFSVSNVNGRIEMQDIAGSGKARTVNGGVKVSFRENPRENSAFTTVNGEVNLQFVKGLSADFRFKTFNGDVFSDFEMTSLPAKNANVQQHNGRFVFRSDRSTGARVGSGGPEIKAENLNGSIRVLERHQ
jgi:putative adhesin